MEPILTQEETEAIYSAMNEASAGRAAIEEASLVESREYLSRAKSAWDRSSRVIKSDVERVLAGALGKRVSLELFETGLMPESEGEDQEWSEESPADSAVQAVTTIVSIGKTQLIIDIDPVMARRYTERKVGAQTDPGDSENASTQFTILERKILQELILDLAKVLSKATSNNGEISLVEEDVTYFLETMKTTEPWLEVKFTTYGSPEMNIGFKGPASFFSTQSKGASSLVTSHLSSSNMEISVELGTTLISVSELVDLAPGTFIPLNVAVGDTFKVLVDGVPKFHGEPLVSRGNIAVRVVNRFNNGVS